MEEKKPHKKIIQLLSCLGIGSEQKGIWKFHFVPQSYDAWCSLYNNNNNNKNSFEKRIITERFLDTQDLLLARKNIFLKKAVEGDVQLFKVKTVLSRKEQQQQQRLKYTDKHFKEEQDAIAFIKKRLANSSPDHNIPLEQLTEVCTMLIQRASFVPSSVPNLTITYDQVEYPEGDLYTICSATSVSSCTENAFISYLKHIAALSKTSIPLKNGQQSNSGSLSTVNPARSRYSEWLRRYRYLDFSELVDQGNFTDQQQPYYQFFPIFESYHPQSTRSRNYRKASAREFGLSGEELDQFEAEFNSQFEDEEEKAEATTN